MDRFCIAPFAHIAVDPGKKINPCCMFSPTIYKEKYDNLKQAFDGDENKALRQKMLNNEYIEACSKCYIDEKVGKKSYRQFLNERYGHEYINNPTIKELEISYGNKCNLKCVTCNSYHSSAWEKEDELLSKIIPRKIIPNYNLDNESLLDGIDLNQVTNVKVLGGEPLLDKKYVELFNKLDKSNVTLFIITNNTIAPSNIWLDAFKDFKLVKIVISIDGINDTSEFCRYGTKFSRFEKLFKKWHSLKYHNLEITPHFVINTFNVFNFNETFEWLCNFYYTNDFLSYDFLDAPEYLNIKYLPLNIKQDIIDYINPLFKDEFETFLNNEYNESHMIDLIKYYNFLLLRTDPPNIIRDTIKKIKLHLQ